MIVSEEHNGMRLDAFLAQVNAYPSRSVAVLIILIVHAGAYLYWRRTPKNAKHFQIFR